MIPEFWCQVEVRGLQRHAYRRIENLASAVEQEGMIEIHVLPLQAEINVIAGLAIDIQGELRRARVRRRHRCQRILQGLKALHTGVQIPPVAVVKQVAFAGQVGLRSRRNPFAQIDEISIVGHTLQVESARETIAEPLLMLPGVTIAGLLFLPVIRKVLRPHFATQTRL